MLFYRFLATQEKEAGTLYHGGSSPVTRGASALKRHSIGNHLIFKASVNQTPKRVIHISPSIDPPSRKKKRASPGVCRAGPRPRCSRSSHSVPSGEERRIRMWMRAYWSEDAQTRLASYAEGCWNHGPRREAVHHQYAEGPIRCYKKVPSTFRVSDPEKSGGRGPTRPNDLEIEGSARCMACQSAVPFTVIPDPSGGVRQTVLTHDLR